MATTVFPITDQTATKSLWDAMAASIDRGEADPLSSLDNESYDDRRLQYKSSTSATTSTDTFATLLSIQIDLGEVFLVEFFCTTNDINVTSPGDELDLRVSVPSGCVARGVSYAKLGDVSAAGVNVEHINTTSTQVISGRSNTDPSQDIENKILMVVTASTGGGEVKIEWAKGNNFFGNGFSLGYGYMIGRRIW